jgi:energy-coupling factor transport system ATP-binding protein
MLMLIKLEHVSHVYKANTPYESKALDDVNLEIAAGDFVGLIGHTGSGKSTLVQHLNGLLFPTAGRVLIGGEEIKQNSGNLKKIRQKVGLVFQYPEHQLFEETIYQDIGFGPKNLGLESKEIEKRVREAMEAVHLDYKSLKDRSPFALSGGQMRRVAIAGVLAMRPEVLILDEPTAGLDPKGREDILEEIAELHQNLQITVILVSHSMEDIARYTNRVVVMSEGKIALNGSAQEIFTRVEELENLGLGIPMVSVLMHRLKNQGIPVPVDIFTVADAKEAILKWQRGKKNA